MKIEYNGRDDVILNPDELAREFQLSPDALRRYLHMGLVASTVERGEGIDLGKTRITVRVGNRIWRAISEHGHLIHQESRVLGATALVRSVPLPAPD